VTTDGTHTLLAGRGQQSTYDAALANQRSLEGQVQYAKPRCNRPDQTSIPDIRSPIDGKIGRTARDRRQCGEPGIGRADPIVSQAPMFTSVRSPVRDRAGVRDPLRARGGFNAGG